MLLSSWLRNRTSTRGHKPRTNRSSTSFRPHLESLDERALPSHFASPAVYPIANTGTLGPMATADFNGDGKLDLVSVDPFGQDVTVLLGKAKGQFTVAGYYGISTGTWRAVDLAVGDINGDGKLDLVAANYTGDSSFYGALGGVSVILGNGDGSFQNPRQTPNSTDGTSAVALGDVNGDGRLDIVTAGPTAVTVLFNNGYSRTYADAGGESVQVADLNGDGKPDIATSTHFGNTLFVLLNSGDGTFGAAQTYATGGSPHDLAFGDFNGDGAPDLVTANFGTNNVSVFLNTGAGTFGTAQNYAVGGYANFVAVGDFNRDGKLDLAVAGAELDVLLGNGDGTFAIAEKVGPAGNYLVVGDFNNDGFPDLAQSSSNSVEVFLNAANWTGNKHK